MYNNGFPQGYSYYQNQAPPMQLVQPSIQNSSDNGIIWVQGEAGARAYLVPAGKSAMLESLDKLVDILKDLDEIENGTGGYSQRRMYNYDYDNRNSYRNNGRYSRHGNDAVLDHLYKAMDQAQSEAERQAIQMSIDKIMNN